MKKIITAVILLSILFALSGCANKAQEDDARGIEPVVTDDNSGDVIGGEDTDVFRNTGLEDLSVAYAVQMANGDFSKIVGNFSPTVKAQLSEAYLKQTWDITVADLGTYIGVYDITVEDTTEERPVINIYLCYENNGLQIAFTYDNKSEIDALWLSYFTIESETAIDEMFDEIVISIGKEPYILEGMLTLPKGTHNPPVIILVHGSGSHDMDETIGAVSNKPFRDLAWGLAKQGIATIRYHERAYQYPLLAAEEEVTIYLDSLYDVAEAVAYAISSDRIDRERIYVLGHSLGGMLTPKIAADYTEVKGIISLAGSPRRLEDIIIDQQEFFNRNTEGITENQGNALMTMVREAAERIKDLTEEDTDVLLGVPSSYWYSLNMINTEELAKELTIPFLILQGGEDWQVYPDKDYAAWKELLQDKENVSFRLYDNLNHLFMTSNGRKDVSEYNIKGTVDQQVIDDIVQWIYQQ